MSCWTHITACLSVETGIIEKRSELKRRIQRFLKYAPKITGSEGPADVFVNVQSGHNFFISHDCEHCRYKDSLRDVVENGEKFKKCDAPVGYECSNEYQTCVVISMQGDLRDKDGESTKQEFIEFKKYIEKEFSIRDYSINIEDEYGVVIKEV